MPVWTPGSRDVTYLDPINGNHDVWRKPADGTSEATLVADTAEDIATVDWSRDGEWLFLRTSEGISRQAARNVLAMRPG